MAEKKKDEKSGKWRIYVVFGFLFLLLFIGYGIGRLRLQWAIDEKLEQFREMGYPTTIQEIADEYNKEMPENNSAKLFEDAENFYKTLPFKSPGENVVAEKKQIRRSEKFSPVMLSETKEYLDYYAEYMKLIYMALEIPECKPQIDFSKGCEIGEFIPRTYMGMELFLIEALYAAETGDSEQAITSIESYYKLTKVLLQFPLPFMTHISGKQRDVAEYLQHIIARAYFNDQQLAALEKMLKNANRGDLARASVVSAIFGIDEIERVYNGTINNPLDVDMNLYRRIGREKVEINYLLNLKMDLSNAFRKGFPDSYADHMKICERYTEYITPHIIQMPVCPVLTTQILLMKSIPSSRQDPIWSGDFIHVEASCVARINVARMAIAVERFRLKYGRMPLKLDEVAPEFIDKVLPDPYTGKPLKYTFLFPIGFAVYSAGENQIDDNCSEIAYNEYGYVLNRSDICFILEK